MIKPGMSIPADGEVIQGGGFVDQAAITGESMPVEKNVGDKVISATINRNGSCQHARDQGGRRYHAGADNPSGWTMRVTPRPPSRSLADKVSGVFVPVVIGIALVTAIVWLICGETAEFALSCAISVLVISCPCALGLATPVAIMVGTGKAAEMGILIKSAESLESLHSIDTIVLDKTGTITSGRPSVTDIIPLNTAMSARELLESAAALESGSEHPLATAIMERAGEEGISAPKADDFEAVAGSGRKGQCGRQSMACGQRRVHGARGRTGRR